MPLPTSTPAPLTRTDELLVILIEQARTTNRHLEAVRDLMTNANALLERGNDQRRASLAESDSKRTRRN